MKIKTIGVVLLSKDNYYEKNGKLPTRPKWDKEFITNLVKGRKVYASENTIKNLPKSILDICELTDSKDYDINFWIASFKSKPDMFIVIRSKEDLNGWKKFHENYFDSYNQIMDINNIEIYFLKHI